MARPIQSKTFAQKRKRRTVSLAVFGALAVASWSFVLANASFARALAISEVRVYGADPAIEGSLKAAAARNLAGAYLGLFSRSNTLIYPQEAVIDAVKRASPRVDAVEVGRDGLRALAIKVSERAPESLVCAGYPDIDGEGALMIGDDCYMADSSGFMFRRAEGGSAAGKLVIYAPGLQSADLAGSFATSTGEFAEIMSFVSGARAAGLGAEAVLIKPAGEYEMYFRDPRHEEALAVLYFSSEAGFDEQISNLASFWRDFGPAAAGLKGPKQAFESIDVRYGSNVFYRVIQ